jgi:hypothetical protein
MEYFSDKKLIMAKGKYICKKNRVCVFDAFEEFGP